METGGTMGTREARSEARQRSLTVETYLADLTRIAINPLSLNGPQFAIPIPCGLEQKLVLLSWARILPIEEYRANDAQLQVHKLLRDCSTAVFEIKEAGYENDRRGEKNRSAHDLHDREQL